MLILKDVTIKDRKTQNVLFGPLTYEFKEPGLYYVHGKKSQENALIALTGLRMTPSEGEITYRGIKISRYEELNRNYEDTVYENHSLFIPRLSVLDNYLIQLFAIYKSRDYALDVVAPYLEMMPDRIDADRPYGKLDRMSRSLVELFAINFSDYRVALLRDPFGDMQEYAFPKTYFTMLETLRAKMLIIVSGRNSYMDEMEHLDMMKSTDLTICRIGEMSDEES